MPLNKRSLLAKYGDTATVQCASMRVNSDDTAADDDDDDFDDDFFFFFSDDDFLRFDSM
jgi:hypothetical protein